MNDDMEAIEACVDSARRFLLSNRLEDGHWEGHLSSSAVSTAVGTMALHLKGGEEEGVASALDWLVEDQNEDGGWGDTPNSPSNLPTTILSCSALKITGGDNAIIKEGLELAKEKGGFDALGDYYGADMTFQVPIKAMAALAGLLDWDQVPPLPYEVMILPRFMFRVFRISVVSYALPALAAIGILVHEKGPNTGTMRSFFKRRAKGKALRMVRVLQPESGGYLEAAPLTGFVAAALIASGHRDHPSVGPCIDFLKDTRRKDGSWPIDTNLSVWVTTHALRALKANGEDISGNGYRNVLKWILMCQSHEGDIYANTPPGGWPWTDLPGGVQDADDTAGVLLALKEAGYRQDDEAVVNGKQWLLHLQNPDGGWPTFCRGWNKLPFDKSCADIAGHVLVALAGLGLDQDQPPVDRALAWLRKDQDPDGSWKALWFGNQFAEDRQNRTYATSKVLEAYGALGLGATEEARAGMEYILGIQNKDGGWGGGKGLASTCEETAIAIQGLSSIQDRKALEAARKGAQWLIDNQGEDGSWMPSPIGLYYALLWYHERLYPAIFTMRALGRLKGWMKEEAS